MTAEWLTLIVETGRFNVIYSEPTIMHCSWINNLWRKTGRCEVWVFWPVAWPLILWQYLKSCHNCVHFLPWFPPFIIIFPLNVIKNVCKDTQTMTVILLVAGVAWLVSWQGYGLTAWGSIPGGARDLPLLQNAQTSLRAHPASYSGGTRDPPPLCNAARAWRSAFSIDCLLWIVTNISYIYGNDIEIGFECCCNVTVGLRYVYW